MVEMEQQAQFVLVCKKDPSETLLCFAAYSFVSTHRARSCTRYTLTRCFDDTDLVERYTCLWRNR